MTAPGRTKRSVYMEWAKRHSHARFTLATSGVIGMPMEEFPLDLEQLDVTSPGGYGYAPLQERLARHNNVSVECVVAATGTSMANHLAMAAVLDAGDEVLIEEPAYGPLLDVAEYLGARIKRIPRRVEAGFALEPAEVEKAITRETRLFVLSNLHNPSGALAPAATLRAVGEIAHRTGARVLVDEVYLEVLFDRSAPFCFPIGQAIASTEQNPFIVTSSLTKVYGLSGLRCGWVLAAPELAQRIWLLNDLYGAVAAHPAERMSVMALDHLDRFRERARALLTTNRALVDSFLDSRSDLDCFRPPAGTVVFPRLKRGDPDVFLALLREKYETTVVPGSFFEMPQHFRIGMGGDTASLRGGLERLSAALDEFGRR
ncbi:MAG: pyridoxal phosphate-dependent aminotransferase [Candidatus Acidiferrum sp.]